MMHRTQLAAVAAALVTIGSLAAPARAIEMFTNFNNGTELGTRPLDVDEMSPVRVHAWQGHWHGPLGRCFNDAADAAAPRSEYAPGERPVGVPALSGRDHVKANRQPTVVDPTATKSTGRRSDSSADDDWLRSSNFLPPNNSN
ncbi:MAG TPA: hypothetical protein VGH32_07270 [Pirellulales bacterium]